jgi:hypothetical protein
MEFEANMDPRILDARLANIEYSQSLVSRSFLRNLTEIIQLTQPVRTNKDLFRLGHKADGGYVLAPEFTSNLCLNLGVGYEVSADLDLLSRGFKIFAFDGTVPNPLSMEENYFFTQKNIGYRKNDQTVTNLKEILRDHPQLEALDLLLIDIEGHEYEVLEKEAKVLAKAKQIVIEFHGLELLGDEHIARGVIRKLKKVSKTHSPVHVHANNSGGGLFLGGASWPTILEITFLKREYCTREINYGPFPGFFDYPNVGVRPDMDLTPFYGQNKSYAVLARNLLGLN